MIVFPGYAYVAYIRIYLAPKIEEDKEMKACLCFKEMLMLPPFPSY